MIKKYVEERYNLLFKLYGVQSRGWSMLHEQFNRYVFCPDNCKSLIVEYLIWEDFVEDARNSMFLIIWEWITF